MRFRSIPELGIAVCVLFAFALLQGCGSGGDSMDAHLGDGPSSNEVADAEASAAPVSESVTDTSPQASLETKQAGDEPADMQEQSAIGPVPTLPAASELPADGASVTWELPPATVKGALNASPTLPETPVQVTGQGTEPMGPQTAADAGPPSPFSENPLREGTDDFPDGPTKAPVSPQVASVRSVASSVPGPIAEGSTGSPKNKHSKAEDSDEPFDPIAENGTIFEGWEKPRVALLISGRQDGYLEPCGCAGLERMKGGLTRRHSLFKRLRAEGWPVVGLDCGGLVKGFGRQAELKFHLSVDAMQKMGYSAIALGTSDLRLPAGELLSRVASSEEAPSPFVSANVAVLLGFDAKIMADHRIVAAGGLRIGITSVLGTAWQKQINNSEIEMATPAAKLREVLPKLKEKSDLRVLLAHATREETIDLAGMFPEFDIVVSAGGNSDPPEAMQVLEKGTRLIEVGEKGMYAVVLGIYDGGKVAYQRVPLDSRFEDSPDMKEFMRQYQEQLRADGLAGLGIRPVPHPQAKELGKFVGSKKCEECHEESYDVWKKSGHSDAWKTLANLEVPRTFDPECISCHVVGWHPTQYFPYESGFLSEAETPELVNVGCEDCHGPGEMHVKAEMGSDEALQLKYQKAAVVTKEQMRDSKAHWCLNCHDGDNSPDFNFDEYWPEIEHKEDVFADEGDK